MNSLAPNVSIKWSPASLFRSYIPTRIAGKFLFVVQPRELQQWYKIQIYLIFHFDLIEGCVKIQIFDHRIRYKCLQKDEEKVYSRIYTLKPTIKTFWNDMKRVVGNAASLDMNKLGKSELEFALDVESEVLVREFLLKLNILFVVENNSTNIGVVTIT